MTPSGTSPRLAASQWFLNLGIAATLGSHLWLSREMLPCFRTLYRQLGFALPIPTLIIFHPNAVVLTALSVGVASVALNLVLNGRKHLLLPGLSLLLTLSACLAAALVFAVLLPLLEPPQVLL